MQQLNVGDTGTTRGGYLFEITKVDPESDATRYTATLTRLDAKGVSIITTRATFYPDGRYWYDGSAEDSWDLISVDPAVVSPPPDPAAANCTIVALLLAAGHVTKEQVEAAKRLAEMTR